MVHDPNNYDDNMSYKTYQEPRKQDKVTYEHKMGDPKVIQNCFVTNYDRILWLWEMSKDLLS